MQRAKIVGRGRRGDALQDARRHLDNRDFQAARGGNGGSLEADIAAAYDEQAPAGFELVRHGVGVGQRPQRVDTGKVAAGSGCQTARGRTGRDEKSVIFQHGFVGQDQRLFVAIDGIDGDADAAFDPVFGKPFGRA